MKITSEQALRASYKYKVCDCIVGLAIFKLANLLNYLSYWLKSYITWNVSQLFKVLSRYLEIKASDRVSAVLEQQKLPQKVSNKLEDTTVADFSKISLHSANIVQQNTFRGHAIHKIKVPLKFRGIRYLAKLQKLIAFMTLSIYHKVQYQH